MVKFDIPVSTAGVSNGEVFCVTQLWQDVFQCRSAVVWPFDDTIEFFWVETQLECAIALGNTDQRVNPVSRFIYFGYDTLLYQCV